MSSASLNNPQDQLFLKVTMWCRSKLHTYDDVVDKVAQKLGLEDLSKLSSRHTTATRNSQSASQLNIEVWNGSVTCLVTTTRYFMVWVESLWHKSYQCNLWVVNVLWCLMVSHYDSLFYYWIRVSDEVLTCEILVAEQILGNWVKQVLSRFHIIMCSFMQCFDCSWTLMWLWRLFWMQLL